MWYIVSDYFTVTGLLVFLWNFYKFLQHRDNWLDLCVGCHCLPFRALFAEKEIPKKSVWGANRRSFGENVLSIFLTIVHDLIESRVTCSLKWPLEVCPKFWVPIARVVYPWPLGNFIHIDGLTGRWGLGRHWRSELWF